jgi:nucleoside diphosphate kinase
MSLPDISAIVSAFKRVTSSETDSEFVVPYGTAPADTNQFLFFLKPEATTANVEYILKLSLDVLAKAGVKFGAVRVVGGPYLDKHNIMVEHYGVISKISKEGYEVISDAAKEKLQKDFEDDVKAVGLPVGGHQWLVKNPEFNPLSLTTINDNVGTTRLAGGTYLCKFKVLGKVQLVLNPFHAYQLVPFISKGNALIVFECQSSVSWGDLRTKLCGATNPEKAEAGSIRAELLKNKEATGMVAVNMSSNGVHMSAGPLEGLVELQRFFSDGSKKSDLKSFSFGAYLSSQGLTDEQINKLAENPNLTVEGKTESVFDMTEEKCHGESAKILKTALGL